MPKTRQRAARHTRKAFCILIVTVVGVWPIAAGRGDVEARQAAAPFDLEEATIASLVSDQQSGKRTAHAIAEQYLARIDAIDRNGPALRSVIERNPDALTIADALDVERQTKGMRGPLHGIPVLIKDNIDTADRM